MVEVTEKKGIEGRLLSASKWAGFVEASSDLRWMAAAIRHGKKSYSFKNGYAKNGKKPRMHVFCSVSLPDKKGVQHFF